MMRPAPRIAADHAERAWRARMDARRSRSWSEIAWLWAGRVATSFGIFLLACLGVALGCGAYIIWSIV